MHHERGGNSVLQAWSVSRLV